MIMIRRSHLFLNCHTCNKSLAGLGPSLAIKTPAEVYKSVQMVWQHCPDNLVPLNVASIPSSYLIFGLFLMFSQLLLPSLYYSKTNSSQPALRPYTTV